jgi:hypothetical protein
MAIRVTANGLRNIIRSVILEESQRRNSQRRLQESRRRAYRLYEGFEDKLAKYDPNTQELSDIQAAKEKFSPTARSGRVGDPRAHLRSSKYDNQYIAGDPMRSVYMEENGAYGESSAVGTVAKLHSMVTSISDEDDACSVLDLDMFEPLLSKAAGEIIFYQDTNDMSALNDAMSKVRDMLDFIYTNEIQYIDGCEDSSDGIQRLYNQFGGDSGYGY